MVGREKDTTMCFPAKGYQIIEGVDNKTGIPFYEYHGHLLPGADEDTPANPEITNMRIPGSYWMDGGVFKLEGGNCYDLKDGSKYCDDTVLVKAEGKFYDICYEMGNGLGVETVTHCDLIDSRSACKRVNTCEWTADNACAYTPFKRLAKGSKRHLKVSV